MFFPHPLAWASLSAHLPKWISITICFVSYFFLITIYVEHLSSQDFSCENSRPWPSPGCLAPRQECFLIQEALTLGENSHLLKQSVLVLFGFKKSDPQGDITVERESQKHLLQEKTQWSHALIPSENSGSEMWKTYPSPHYQSVLCPTSMLPASLMEPAVSGEPN